MAFFGSHAVHHAPAPVPQLDITTFWGFESESRLRDALPRTFQHSLTLERFTVARVDEIPTGCTGPIIRLLQDFGLRCDLVHFLVFVMAAEPAGWTEDTPYHIKIVCVTKTMYEAESRRQQPLLQTLQHPWTDSVLMTP